MRSRRGWFVALAVVAFGVAAALVKGDNPGVRGQIGNLSTPWVLVALLPASGCRTAARGAAVGLLATLAALVAFYLTLTGVLAGHLGGGGFAREAWVELHANRIYLLAGIVSGPLAGAFGSWLGRRGRDALWLAAGALATLEIAAVFVAQGPWAIPGPAYFAWGVTLWSPYIAESVIGIAILATVMLRRRAGLSSASRSG